jgi:hypothetical protein
VILVRLRIGPTILSEEFPSLPISDLSRFPSIVFGPLKNGNDTTIPALPTTVVYEYVLRERVLPQSKHNDVYVCVNEAVTLSAYNQIVSMGLEVESLLDKPSNTSTRRVLGVMMDLRRIVHSLGTIGFAFLGGALGRLLYSRRFI